MVLLESAEELLTQVLRDEWGFEGAVVSDWGAVSDRVAALEAGLDLEMPGSGGVTDAEIMAAVQRGELDEAVVDRSVQRVLALTARVTPATGTPETRVAVIGEFAVEARFQGGGSSHVNPTRVDTVLDAIRALGTSVSHARGLDDDAVEIAREADVTVVFAGLKEIDESEGYDRDTIALPDEQIDLIRRVAAVSARTVVVLSHGGVVSLEGWHDDVDAILDGWLLGQAGGSALADLLYGIANPSGHLAETIPSGSRTTPVT